MSDYTMIEVKQAYEDLYARYGDDLTRFATGLVGPSDAADVVSDAMLRFWRSHALLDADNPRALMYRGVLTSARSWQRSVFRRRKRERRTAERLVSHDPDIRPEIAQAVLELSPRQGACVFLMYWEDLGVDEIAALLSITSGSVKQHLYRARQHLEEVLDG